MTTPSIDDEHLSLVHDPRELAVFLSARIRETEQHTDQIAALEETGSRFGAFLSSAHLRAAAAANARLLEMHPGPRDRDGYCPGCVGPYDYTPVHSRHCPIQLVLARIWETHPDFPAWVLHEEITRYRHED
ncbi:hypothetical protein ABT034_33030 [Streptomyces sp. NPDC002773]|uniref:hypothetical protein n=1 Tax=Streptomyces sp. NPDC002773 TaxID=3154430 RepID=UPI003334252C